MWSHEESVEVNAAPAKVWALWQDVGSWPRWDAEVEWSRLDGDFAVGTRGALKPKGGPVTRFELTALEPGRGFTDVTRLPLTRLRFVHRLEPSGQGARISHRVEMEGPLTFLFSRLIGRNIARGLPHAMRALATLAEAP